MSRRMLRVTLGLVFLIGGLIPIALVGMEAVVDERMFGHADETAGRSILWYLLLGGAGLLAGVVLLVTADKKQ